MPDSAVLYLLQAVLSGKLFTEAFSSTRDFWIRLVTVAPMVSEAFVHWREYYQNLFWLYSSVDSLVPHYLLSEQALSPVLGSE